MNCTNCNAPLSDDALFCSECGQIVEAQPQSEPVAAFCQECGTPITPGDAFCGGCGAPLGAPAQEVSAEVEPDYVPVEEAEPYVAPEATHPVSKKKFPVKILAIAAAAVLVVVLAVLMIPKFFSGEGKTHNYAVYVKDGELQYLSMPKGKDPLEVSSRLLDGDNNDAYTQSSLYLSPYINMSKDGKTLFFPDKIDASSYGGVNEFTLYFRDISSKKSDSQKIDSGLTSYSINEAGTLVTYIKDGNLYQHNLKEKTKIDSDVVSYRVSKDGKSLVYFVLEADETEGVLFQKNGKKDAEKITSGVTRLSNVSEDFSRIMYYKEDTLYVKESGKDPVKISSEVENAVFFKSGEVYYLKTGEPIKASAFFINDLEGEDADYYADMLSEQDSDYEWSSLYYFDGKESTLLTDYAIATDMETAVDATVACFIQIPDGALPTVKLSEMLDDPYTTEEKLTKNLMASCVISVATKATVADLDLELSDDFSEFLVSADGQSLYITTEYDEENDTVTLNKVTLSGGKVKEMEVLDEEVYDSIRLAGDSSVIYFKDVNDDYEGELYLDGTKLADDVYRWYLQYDEDTGNVYYMVDWNDEKEQGTLMYHANKKNVTVKDDVHDYCITPGGEILFLYDYSLNSYKGELWMSNGKKASKVDDDVSVIFPIY